MEIVGSGFLARNLQRQARSHPGTVVLAAGVSNTSCRSEDEFQREAELVYRTISRCHKEGRQLLFFSSASSAMYGAPDCPGQEDEPVYPQSMYGHHKLSLEAVIKASGVDFIILRLTYVIGAYQRAHHLLPNLIAQLQSGIVNIYRGAHRDIIAVDDLVTIIDMLLKKGISGTVVNIASGFSVPAENIVAHLENRLGTSAQWHWFDKPNNHQISTARLAALVPGVAKIGFGSDYYQRALDRYIDLYT